jgi:hypothetical protein
MPYPSIPRQTKVENVLIYDSCLILEFYNRAIDKTINHEAEILNEDEE